jgi:hypothetical protein
MHGLSKSFFHFSKIISIVIFLLPFFLLLVFYPIVFGFYTRPLFPHEVFVAFAIHFLFSILGVSIGIFFNEDMFKQKNHMLPMQALMVLVCVIPLGLIFKSNEFIRFAVYFLPPVNFLYEKLFTLHNDIFAVDMRLIIFLLYSLGYSAVLTGLYLILIRKKSKR